MTMTPAVPALAAVALSPTADALRDVQALPARQRARKAPAQ